MLKAKTKEQVFSKKKSSKFFFRRSPKNSIQKYFSGDLQKKKQKKSSQIFREVCGVFQQNFNDSENSAVL